MPSRTADNVGKVSGLNLLASIRRKSRQNVGKSVGILKQDIYRPVLSDGLAKCSELESKYFAYDELFSRLMLQLDAKGLNAPT